MSKDVQDLASCMYISVSRILVCCTLFDFMHCTFTQNKRYLYHFTRYVSFQILPTNILRIAMLSTTLVSDL